MQEELFPHHQKQLFFDYNLDNLAFNNTASEKLVKLLTDNLDFHNHRSNYATHNFHSFPAKFPPQLPLKFILSLTEESDVVLDPMMGSGTTVVEALLNKRCAIGFDIDPLAVMITKVKTNKIELNELLVHFRLILKNAKNYFAHKQDYLKGKLSEHWDSKSKVFIDNWFAPETQLELMALLTQIERIEDENIKIFFKLVFSSTIITKSGGVSLALDLAHTRPHKAKVVIDREGKIIIGNNFKENSNSRLKFLTKKMRSTFDVFEKRFSQNIKSLIKSDLGRIKAKIEFGDAQCLPLDDDSVDLIVTSPPYASNAIDYMRAHKFSLIWLGYSLADLTLKRKEYIGGENTINAKFMDLPSRTMQIISEVSKLDIKRGRVLHRYYSEMKKVLREMYRILKPNKSSIVVVGNSSMLGVDTRTHECLAEIGEEIGFQIPKIGTRRIDRNKRMLPAGKKIDLDSQIQQRMHKEYVVGFYKP